MAKTSDIETLLRELTDGQGLHRELGDLMHYCQFLLDDEEMLTKSGNLNAGGRQRLHERMGEVFGYETEKPGEEEEEHAVDDAEGDA